MAYIGKSPAGLGVRARYYYTATGGETSISGADDNGRTLQFTDGEYVDVYLNGVLLVAGTDYGTGTANTISGLDALSSGNIVEIVAYDIFSLGKANTEALRRRYYKTATGGETSISGSDDDGQTITFAANAEIEVYLNGVALVQGDDYNTSAANTVGGLAALDADDIVTIVAYEEFVLGDVVSKKSGGTFGNSISVSGDLTVDTDTLHVDSTNNRVGIGTSSPSYELDVKSVGEADIRIDSAAGNDGALRFAENGTNAFTIYHDAANSSLAFYDNTNISERMRIDASGRVTMPSQPTFHARRTSSTALASGNNITYNATYINKGSHYNTTNGRFTAPVDGAYLFFWSAIGNNTNDVYRLYLYQNGVKAGAGDMHLRQDTTASGSEYATNGSRTVILDLNANDYVYINFGSDGGTALYSGTDYLTFGGYLIG